MQSVLNLRPSALGGTVATSMFVPELFFFRIMSVRVGRDSSVVIATGYGIDGPGIESRWGERFFAQVQTGPEAHPASCTMGTGSFPGAKRPGRGADQPPLLAPRSRKSRAIPLPPPPLGHFRPVMGPLMRVRYRDE
jgi:hypothetical protein